MLSGVMVSDALWSPSLWWCRSITLTKYVVFVMSHAAVLFVVALLVGVSETFFVEPAWTPK